MEILMGKASQCLSFKKHSTFSHPFALASITAWECNETAAWSTDRQSTCLVRWCTCKWGFSMHGSMRFFFLSFKQCSHQTATPREYIGWNFIPYTIVISSYKNLPDSSTLLTAYYHTTLFLTVYSILYTECKFSLCTEHLDKLLHFPYISQNAVHSTWQSISNISNMSMIP